MHRQSFWNHRFTRTRIKSEKVQLPEMLFGYILGPMGASISGSIFGSILQSYFTDVLRLDLRFLSRLQLVSTVLIVAANLLVGQLIERTRATAGKARPWLLLSVFTFSSASVLMFIVPFQGIARMVWIAVAYNLYYSFASPIYSTASSIMISVSTRDSRQRGLLASINSMVGLGVMGTCSMVFPMLVSFFLRENIHRWFFTMLGVPGLPSTCSLPLPGSVSPRSAAFWKACTGRKMNLKPLGRQKHPRRSLYECSGSRCAASCGRWLPTPCGGSFWVYAFCSSGADL